MTLLRSGLMGLFLSGAALAAEPPNLNIEFSGVRAASGSVRLTLCGDAKAHFPGGCRTYAGEQKASADKTTVQVAGVAPGRYALQAYHDENDDGRAQIPPEGYAFGNDAPYPPSFERASIEVTGGAQTVRVRMNYFDGPPARRQNSQGATPPDGVQRIDLRERGLYGELYLPAGSAKRSLRPVLLIGGSEGGLDIISQMALSFANAGYAALALAYWGETGLPQTLENIPLEYFDGAVAWLRARPETRPSSVAVIGWSRGAEAALLVASRNRSIGAVVGVSPSSIVWQGLANGPRGQPAWTVNGRGVPYAAPDASAYRPGMTSLLPVFERALHAADRSPETAIPVERIGGGVLLITGSDDQLWPAKRFADRIVARLQGAGFRHPVEHLEYAGAGHAVFVGAPDGPMSRMAASGGMMGGTQAANAAAWADNWPRTLAFLQRSFEGAAR
jgi:uncharacterized protein (DUF2141 family)/dienelactone hydrolase